MAVTKEENHDHQETDQHDDGEWGAPGNGKVAPSNPLDTQEVLTAEPSLGP